MAAETDAGELSTDGLPRKKFSGKKLVLFVVLPLVLLIGAGAGVYFSGLLDGLLGKEKPAEEGSMPPPRRANMARRPARPIRTRHPSSTICRTCW